MRRSLFSFLLIFALFSLFFLPGQTTAQVSHPSKIPDLNKFRCPQIEPGKSAVYGFNVTNRYNSSIENVTITVELYKVANEKSAIAVSSISDAPDIQGGEGYIATYQLGIFAPGENKTVDCRINTVSATPQGVYFVRHMISFDYLGGHYIMKSPGHFTRAQWAKATEGGSINITYLGVDGILPDSSFGIKSPTPMWPLYTMFGIAIILGCFSVALYQMEELGKYPGLRRALHRVLGKYYETEYELGHSLGRKARYKTGQKR